MGAPLPASTMQKAALSEASFEEALVASPARISTFATSRSSLILLVHGESSASSIASVKFPLPAAANSLQLSSPESGSRYTATRFLSIGDGVEARVLCMVFTRSTMDFVMDFMMDGMLDFMMDFMMDGMLDFMIYFMMDFTCYL